MRRTADEASRGGPFECSSFPGRLRAHVVEPGPCPRIHGYDVEGHLASSRRGSDLLYLALLGELPEAWASRALEVVLWFLAPTTVAEAPAHAAGLARLAGGSTSSIVATGAVALAEEARRFLADREGARDWLAGEGPLLAAFRARDDVERAAVARMWGALGGDRPPSAVAGDDDPGLEAALLKVLYAIGIRREDHLLVVRVMARLPCVAAEALAVTPGDLRSYPLNLPRFRYEGEP